MSRTLLRRELQSKETTPSPYKRLAKRRMQRYDLVEAGDLGSSMSRARLSWRVVSGFTRSRPGNSQIWGPRHLPPGAQQFEQIRGEHRIAVLAALALLDADHHALAVDVGYLERHRFGDAQSGTVGHILTTPPGYARHLLRRSLRQVRSSRACHTARQEMSSRPSKACFRAAHAARRNGATWCEVLRGIAGAGRACLYGTAMPTQP